MNLLLDTHAALWWLSDDPTLSASARAMIADPENTVFLSAVVVWEIRIKQGIGKLDLPDDFGEVLDSQRFPELPVTVDHAHAIADLPSIHRDPFDRMLVAQAIVERMTIVTRDKSIAAYDVNVIVA
ncbi:MAG: PIN domain nuclease [Deltaproteobacteria bacterium]|nr:MAG: PIN domain nuclease [Deltaproteobacteria bacterium]